MSTDLLFVQRFLNNRNPIEIEREKGGEKRKKKRE